MAVYQSNPEQEDDARFVPGGLAHLVMGTRGRMLDARRTPVFVTAVEPSRGCFCVRIEAFEDQGAQWELGLEEIERFQFPRDAPTAGPVAVAELADARERFDRLVHIDADIDALPVTLGEIEAQQREAAAALGPSLAGLDSLDAYTIRRRGEPLLMDALETFLTERRVAQLDRELARAFATNPNAGELVKTHAMVLARLGLCPYDGRLLRDPEQMRAPWSWALRRRHVVARLGFMRALWDGWGLREIALYRAAATEGVIDPARTASWVSATFAMEVAEAHFEGGPLTVAAAMWRQRVPAERVFMTFMETPALNERFLEAEAILVGNRSAAAF